MKITEKYLRKVIKEEFEKTIVNEQADKEAQQILAAVMAGLKAKGIKLIAQPKIVDVRRYKGSGTGFTIEVETDMGSIGKFIDPEASERESRRWREENSPKKDPRFDPDIYR